MDKISITECNKLIGNFMDFKYSIEEPDYKMRVPHFNIDSKGNWMPNKMVSGRNFSEWADTYQDKKGNGYELSFDTLEFNTSWDWLMPVVEKIEEMDIVASFQIEQPTIYIWASSESSTFENIEIDIFTKSKIEAVYETCIKFIKWYNGRK